VKQPHDCTFSFVRILAKFLDSHHMKFYILEIIVTKCAEKKITSILENGYHVFFFQGSE